MLLPIVAYIPGVDGFLAHGRIVLLCPLEVRKSHLLNFGSWIGQ